MGTNRKHAGINIGAIIPVPEYERMMDYCQTERESQSATIRKALNLYLDTIDDLRNINRDVCDILSGQAPSKLEMGEL